jgi:hypothetical protein
MTGYVLGWENRQNTPTNVLGQKSCLGTGDMDRFIAAYLKNEGGAPSPMPPSAALMGQLALQFECHKSHS